MAKMSEKQEAAKPSACENFEPQAWRKTVCKNCFQPPDKHMAGGGTQSDSNTGLSGKEKMPVPRAGAKEKEKALPGKTPMTSSPDKDKPTQKSAASSLKDKYEQLEKDKYKPKESPKVAPKTKGPGGLTLLTNKYESISAPTTPGTPGTPVDKMEKPNIPLQKQGRLLDIKVSDRDSDEDVKSGKVIVNKLVKSKFGSIDNISDTEETSKFETFQRSKFGSMENISIHNKKKDPIPIPIQKSKFGGSLENVSSSDKRQVSNPHNKAMDLLNKLDSFSVEVRTGATSNIGSTVIHQQEGGKVDIITIPIKKTSAPSTPTAEPQKPWSNKEAMQNQLNEHKQLKSSENEGRLNLNVKKDIKSISPERDNKTPFSKSDLKSPTPENLAKLNLKSPTSDKISKVELKSPTSDKTKKTDVKSPTPDKDQKPDFKLKFEKPELKILKDDKNIKDVKNEKVDFRLGLKKHDSGVIDNTQTEKTESKSHFELPTLKSTKSGNKDIDVKEKSSDPKPTAEPDKAEKGVPDKLKENSVDLKTGNGDESVKATEGQSKAAEKPSENDNLRNKLSSKSSEVTNETEKEVAIKNLKNEQKPTDDMKADLKSDQEVSDKSKATLPGSVTIRSDEKKGIIKTEPEQKTGTPSLLENDAGRKAEMLSKSSTKEDLKTEAKAKLENKKDMQLKPGKEDQNQPELLAKFSKRDEKKDFINKVDKQEDKKTDIKSKFGKQEDTKPELLSRFAKKDDKQSQPAPKVSKTEESKPGFKSKFGKQADEKPELLSRFAKKDEKTHELKSKPDKPEESKAIVKAKFGKQTEETSELLSRFAKKDDKKMDTKSKADKTNEKKTDIKSKFGKQDDEKPELLSRFAKKDDNKFDSKSKLGKQEDKKTEPKSKFEKPEEGKPELLSRFAKKDEKKNETKPKFGTQEDKVKIRKPGDEKSEALPKFGRKEERNTEQKSKFEKPEEKKPSWKPKLDRQEEGKPELLSRFEKKKEDYIEPKDKVDDKKSWLKSKVGPKDDEKPELKSKFEKTDLKSKRESEKNELKSKFEKKDIKTNEKLKKEITDEKNTECTSKPFKPELKSTQTDQKLTKIDKPNLKPWIKDEIKLNKLKPDIDNKDQTTAKSKHTESLEQSQSNTTPVTEADKIHPDNDFQSNKAKAYENSISGSIKNKTADANKSRDDPPVSLVSENNFDVISTEGEATMGDVIDACAPASTDDDSHVHVDTQVFTSSRQKTAGVIGHGEIESYAAASRVGLSDLHDSRSSSKSDDVGKLQNGDISIKAEGECGKTGLFENDSQKIDKKTAEDLEKLRSELKIMIERCQNLEKENEQLLSGFEKKDSEVRDIKKDKSDIETSLKTLQTKVKSMEEKCTKLETDNATLSTNIKSQQDTITAKTNAKEREEHEEKLIANDKIMADMLEENETLKQEINDLKMEMDEMYDSFRDQEAEEFRELQRELEITAKNCRILQFKLRKMERLSCQLEQDKQHAEEKLRMLQNQFQDRDAVSHIHALEDELRMAKDVSVRLHDELDLMEDKRGKLEEENRHLTELLEQADRKQFRLEMEVDKLRDKIIELKQEIRQKENPNSDRKLNCAEFLALHRDVI